MQKNNLIILVLATFLVGSMTAIDPGTKFFKEKSIKKHARRTAEEFCNALKIDNTMSQLDRRFLRKSAKVGGLVMLYGVPLIGSGLGVTLVGGIADAVCKPLGNLLDEGVARTQVQKGIPLLVRLDAGIQYWSFFKPKVDEAKIWLNEFLTVFDEKVKAIE